NFPFYLGFRGGKGIAASAGMLLAMDWRVFLICAVIFIGLVAITRYVSLGSMAAYAGALVCFIGFGAVGSYGMDFPHTLEMDVIMGLMTALAIYRHRANIYRLLNGTENKLGAAKTAAK
ncbi:MAG: glycerol-3-phosphate acyltransferase, partial [Blautia sp.]|nr:glycerol-3-phosphate acyltransferase [Blautia sp.]